MRWPGLAAALVLALVVMVPAGAAAKPVVLTAEGLRTLGFRTMAAGGAARAAEIAAALLERDPDDVAALILKSHADRALERFPEAIAAAARAWQLASKPGQGYAAAMARAQALSSAGRRTAAQIWLRRAAQAAPDPGAHARAVRDFRYVRSRNPWVFDFSGTFAPSSNINNGSASQTIELFGLPFLLSGDARALSGYELSMGASARYRLPPTAYATTELRLSAQHRHYWLSRSAKAQAPDARGSDYDFSALELGISQRRRTDRSIAIFNWGAVLGHNWYGGADLSGYLRLNAGVQRGLGRTMLGFADLSIERQARNDDPMRSATVVGLRGGVQRKLGNGDTLGLQIEARRAKSASIEVDHRTALMRLDWTRARPLAGLAIGMELTAQADHYAQSPYTSDGRRDITLSADLSMVFSKVDYYGFSPRLDLQLSRTKSNVALYRRRDLGLTLGVRSAF